MSNYSSLLRDPRWQRKRLAILNRDSWQCQKCGDKESTLHVHHLSYVSGRKPWEYEDDMLLTLCESCHEYETETRKDYENSLLILLRSNRFMADDIECLIGFILRASARYHPRHLSEALRWNLYNKNGIHMGFQLLDAMIHNFESQGKR
jgi:hypothetical protein